MKILTSGVENNNLVGRVTFPGGGMSKFLACGEETPSFPQQRKPCCPPKKRVKNFKNTTWLSLPEVGENLRSLKAQ